VCWDIELRGAVGQLAAHLEGLPLAAFTLHGNAGQVVLALPQPTGVCAVRLRGNTSRLTIERPAGVAVRFRLHGSAAKLVFDGERASGVTQQVERETPGAAAAEARYEIDIVGTSSDLRIGAAEPDAASQE
jgi:hypothetical protein